MATQLVFVSLLLALVGCDSDDTQKLDSGAAPSDGATLADAANNTDASSLADAARADARIGPDATPNLAMSFFVTSTGSGASGGDLGGLSGADAKCQNLANSAGGGSRTWHAYLSTGSVGPGPAEHARDRIGTGPWRNQQGDIVASTVANLHANGLKIDVIFSEHGDLIPSSEHDILTGTGTDGNVSDASQTCDNWTNGGVNSQAQVGHADIPVNNSKESWNSQHSGSCDQASLAGNAGAGRLYCFAID
ncbi:MAG: hypothetical protein JKY56_02660 [Kofleriaceae bacterium]|nr:hypothetical protein [Kofleriaceae bacterium]